MVCGTCKESLLKSAMPTYATTFGYVYYISAAPLSSPSPERCRGAPDRIPFAGYVHKTSSSLPRSVRHPRPDSERFHRCARNTANPPSEHLERERGGCLHQVPTHTQADGVVKSRVHGLGAARVGRGVRTRSYTFHSLTYDMCVVLAGGPPRTSNGPMRPVRCPQWSSWLGWLGSCVAQT